MEDVDQILELGSGEKMEFEKEQNLYSLIKSIEYLEFAYLSSKVRPNEYDSNFQ